MTSPIQKAHRKFAGATRRMVDVHWNELLDMLIDEFPDAVKFVTFRTATDLTITKVLDEKGVDLLAQRDSREIPNDCTWCEEAESAVFRAGEGHDPECPFALIHNEHVAGEWGSAELEVAGRPHLHWLRLLDAERFDPDHKLEAQEEHDITRPYQYVKLVAVLRLRRTYDNAEDLADILPAESRHGEVMFAATDPGYAGEFDDMGADPGSWDDV